MGDYLRALKFLRTLASDLNLATSSSVKAENLLNGILHRDAVLFCFVLFCFKKQTGKLTVQMWKNLQWKHFLHLGPSASNSSFAPFRICLSIVSAAQLNWSCPEIHSQEWGDGGCWEKAVEFGDFWYFPTAGTPWAEVQSSWKPGGLCWSADSSECFPWL